MAPAGDGRGHADRVQWKQEMADLGLI